MSAMGRLATFQLLILDNQTNGRFTAKKRQSVSSNNRGLSPIVSAFSQLKLEKHPDKTFIGKVEKGFDFLGYHFSPRGLMIANITWTKFVARLHRLYEQEQAGREGPAALGLYVQRWVRWTRAGLHHPGNLILLHPPEDGV